MNFRMNEIIESTIRGSIRGLLFGPVVGYIVSRIPYLTAATLVNLVNVCVVAFVIPLPIILFFYPLMPSFSPNKTDRARTRIVVGLAIVGSTVSLVVGINQNNALFTGAIVGLISGAVAAFILSLFRAELEIYEHE